MLARRVRERSVATNGQVRNAACALSLRIRTRRHWAADVREPGRLRPEDFSQTVHYDTLIVGCGTAGAILAARLSEDSSRSVCVVEAGRDYPSVEALPAGVRSHRSARGLVTSLNDPEVLGFPDWGHVARSTPLQAAVALPRGKIVGGSSSINGGVFFRALREDLDAWAVSNPDWSFEACQPYFKRIERDNDFADDFHGSDGPIPVNRSHTEDWVPLNQAFHAACLDLGFPDCPDFNRPDAWGVGPLPVNIDATVRYSSAVGYLMPAHARSNLTVISDAHAQHITFKGSAACGVEFETGGRLITLEADQIVLAAGAVSSPHLLLLSGIGPREHLQSVGIRPLVDLPGVGQNLRDHPVLCASWSATDVQLPTSGPGTPGQLGLRATTPGSDDPRDMRLVSFRAEGSNRFGIPFSLMHAESAGQLELASRDATAPPRIDFRHLEHPADLRRLRAMLELVERIVEHPAYDRLRLQRRAPMDMGETALEEWMLSTVITGHHISSTCKMGPASDALAVVDQAGRGHGVDHLRVIDSSILPDCPRVNINATTMMLAEKLAAQL
jgi:choline dehydrogenase